MVRHHNTIVFGAEKVPPGLLLFFGVFRAVDHQEGCAEGGNSPIEKFGGSHRLSVFNDQLGKQACLASFHSRSIFITPRLPTASTYRPVATSAVHRAWAGRFGGISGCHFGVLHDRFPTTDALEADRSNIGRRSNGLLPGLGGGGRDHRYTNATNDSKRDLLYAAVKDGDVMIGPESNPELLNNPANRSLLG